MFAASKSGRAAAAAATDASFAYVPLLLETTGTNGQQNNTFLDSSTNAFTITRNGTPTQGSRTPYWPAGQWSNYFSSSYLSVADSASLRFGAANFTIEAWVYRTASGATHTIACKGASTPTGWVLQISSADKLVFIDTSTSITGTTSLAANTWYYVAVVRAGTGASQTTLYVNGVSDGTGTSATTFSQTDAMRVGTDRSATNNFAGYISNLRLSNTNLTISSTPTTPLTASGSTIFLSCGYNRFVDGALNSAITIGTGTPTVQAFQPFSPTASYTTALYGGSGYFGGSPSYLSVPYNVALNLVSGDFTIETWFYCTGLTANEQQILNKDGVNGASYYQYNLGVSSTGTLTAYLGNGAGLSPTFTDYGASTPVPLNSWNHAALVRTGSTIKVFFNGAQVTSTAQVTAMSDGGKALLIGFLASGLAGNYFNGYIANTRIVKGTAVYTGAFKPPTLAPLTTLGTTSAASYTDTTNVNTTFTSGTSLLLNMTNAGIYDAAAQNNLITVGDAQASTTITPKWPPSSMKFDGTGDWLTAVDGPQLQLGTGDFTIEGWVYLSAVGVVYGILSKGTATTGWSVNVTALNKLQFSYTTSNLTGTTTLATGTWYYFAVVRSGSATGNLKLYLNGSVEATSGGAVTDNFNQTSILYVGADRVGATPLNGYLQDVRITKAARTITTPTAAFPTR